jgi:beta-phosphoglucomutase family hydrolase
VLIDWARYQAVLFDLDGVLTPTAEVHRRAWKRTFDRYLADRHPEQPPFEDADYFAHVDGKPRYDGVRDFLRSRHVLVPEGSPEDEPGWDSVCAIGNTKNLAFNEVLAEDGVDPFPGSVRLLDHLDRLGVKVAVVSSSANARAVLTAAGLAGRFPVLIDGIVAQMSKLAGKPSPDTFLEAARRLGSTPEDAVVVEDAISGVAAGAAGAFGLVIGVDREASVDDLLAAGADIVVRDLGETLSPDLEESEPS